MILVGNKSNCRNLVTLLREKNYSTYIFFTEIARDILQARKLLAVSFSYIFFSYVFSKESFSCNFLKNSFLISSYISGNRNLKKTFLFQETEALKSFLYFTKYSFLSPSHKNKKIHHEMQLSDPRIKNFLYF